MRATSPIEITAETLEDLSRYCDEFLIHAADVEGKQQGMDDELIMFLAEHSPIPCTYAGGAKSLADLKHCKVISNGAIDLTIGSALDLFGGKGVKYEDCVSLGMRVAARAAVLLGMLDESAEKRQNALLDALGFVKTFNIDAEAAWNVMAIDKKAEKGARVYILPTKIGSVKKVVNIEKDLVTKSWEAIQAKEA